MKDRDLERKNARRVYKKKKERKKKKEEKNTKRVTWQTFSAWPGSFSNSLHPLPFSLGPTPQQFVVPARLNARLMLFIVDASDPFTLREDPPQQRRAAATFSARPKSISVFPSSSAFFICPVFSSQLQSPFHRPPIVDTMRDRVLLAFFSPAFDQVIWSSFFLISINLFPFVYNRLTGFFQCSASFFKYLFNFLLRTMIRICRQPVLDIPKDFLDFIEFHQTSLLL